MTRFAPTTPESEQNQGSLDAFSVAGGSVCGREHARWGKGSQDAFCWKRTGRSLVAVVCDGCGSGRHSEVGAKLGCRVIAEALSLRLQQGLEPSEPMLWPSAQRDVLAHLRVLARAMGGDLDGVVSDYFLFTLVVAVITPSHTAIYSLGDGLYALNGEVSVLGPYPNNCPPYLGYALLEEREEIPERGQPRALVSTSALDHLLIATDGALDLLAPKCESPVDREPVGPISQFWTRDGFFSNADGMRRRLAVINREVLTADWERQRVERSCGPLVDDTTIVAIRRRVQDAPRDLGHACAGERT